MRKTILGILATLTTLLALAAPATAQVIQLPIGNGPTQQFVNGVVFQIDVLSPTGIFLENFNGMEVSVIANNPFQVNVARELLPNSAARGYGSITGVFTPQPGQSSIRTLSTAWWSGFYLPPGTHFLNLATSSQIGVRLYGLGSSPAVSDANVSIPAGQSWVCGSLSNPCKSAIGTGQGCLLIGQLAYRVAGLSSTTAFSNINEAGSDWFGENEGRVNGVRRNAQIGQTFDFSARVSTSRPILGLAYAELLVGFSTAPPVPVLASNPAGPGDEFWLNVSAGYQMTQSGGPFSPMEYSMPIPNDPALAGLVVFLQPAGQDPLGVVGVGSLSSMLITF